MTFDIKTLFFAHVLQTAVLAGFMGLSAAQNRGRIRGPFVWFLGYLFLTAGLALFVLRDITPWIIGYETGTLLMYTGAFAMYAGTSLFFGSRPLLVIGAVALIASMVVYSYFLRVVPDTSVRVGFFSAVIAACYAASAVCAWRGSEKVLNRPARFASLLYGIASIICFARIVLYLALSHGKDIFDPDSIDVLYFLAALIIQPGVAFAQIQLINGRLLEQLNAAAQERGLLLREMNHRVKNSLSIATSLISLQESKGSDSDCTRALEAVRSRINSIALVHERLSSPDSSGNLRVDLYLEALIANIADNSPRFTLQQHLCGVELDASRALTLGLVVNELIANAVKYASDANGEGYAEVSMDEQNDRITLCIKDKGPGFPQRAENGIGTELVDTLIKQLRGTVARRTEGGAIIELSFPAGKDT